MFKIIKFLLHIHDFIECLLNKLALIVIINLYIQFEYV